MNKRLFAFWKYDTFPYILGGEISDLNEQGFVYIDSYQGWFKPILILPLDEGKRIKSRLISIEKSYNLERKRLKESKIEDILEVCSSFREYLDTIKR